MCRIRSILTTFAVSSLTLTACSKVPEQEQLRATAALDSARTLEAEQYAPDLFRAATDSLNATLAARAQQDAKFALFRSYGATRERFARAEDLAIQTAARATSEKERIKGEVSGILTAVKATLDSAYAAYARAPRGKGSQVDLAVMKATLDQAASVRTEAESDFSEGRYLVARSKLESARDQARAIMREITAARARTDR